MLCIDTLSKTKVILFNPFQKNSYSNFGVKLIDNSIDFGASLTLIHTLTASLPKCTYLTLQELCNLDLHSPVQVFICCLADSSRIDLNLLSAVLNVLFIILNSKAIFDSFTITMVYVNWESFHCNIAYLYSISLNVRSFIVLDISSILECVIPDFQIL